MLLAWWLGERCWTDEAGQYLCSPKLCVTEEWCHVSAPAGPAVGLWMCLEFGGEDSGDGSLCGRRRNKQVPLLYYLPDEPGECCAISQFTRVLVLLSKRIGWKASSGEKSIFWKSICRLFSTLGPSAMMLLPASTGTFNLRKIVQSEPHDLLLP